MKGLVLFMSLRYLKLMKTRRPKGKSSAKSVTLVSLSLLQTCIILVSHQQAHLKEEVGTQVILIPQVFYICVILHTISKVFLKIFVATGSKGNTALRTLVEQLYCIVFLPISS